MLLFDNRLPFCILLTLLLFVGRVSGQQEEMDEMELIQRVAQLQQQLESNSIPDRDAAEKELIELGPQVLNYLEEPESDSTTEVCERLAKVRVELEKVAVARVTGASHVTLKGEMTLGDVLKAIRKQTDNHVVVPEQLKEKTIQADWNETEFWSVIADVIDQTETGGRSVFRSTGPTAPDPFFDGTSRIGKKDSSPAQ